MTTRSTSLRSTWRMPLNTVKKISTATRMKDSATLEASPMPSQITNSGARITRGMALSNVITGSSSSATSGTSAATTPSTMPTAMPSASPPSAAVKVASRCGQMRPSANSSMSAAPIRLGFGAYSGLSMPARPAASHSASRTAKAASWRIQA